MQSLTAAITQVYKGCPGGNPYAMRVAHGIDPLCRFPKVHRMKLRAAKWFAMSVVTTAAFGLASISTEAEACCGFWNCLFGWCGGCGPRCYRPAYGGPSSGCSSGCSTGGYYGPIVYNNCAPCATGCSPCGTGSGTGNCATGNCGVGSTSGSSLIAPAPDPDPNFRAKQRGTPETYMREKEGSSDSELGNSGNLPRTNQDTDGENGASRLNQRDESGFAAPRNAGASSDEDDSSGSTSKSGTGTRRRKDPSVPRADDGDDSNDGARRAPTISVDEKVAWRAAPVRSRTGAKAHTASARLVRLPAYPKSEWLPVDGESKIARN